MAKLEIRLTDRLMEILDIKSRMAGLSRSAYVRSLLFTEQEMTGTLAMPTPVDEPGEMNDATLACPHTNSTPIEGIGASFCRTCESIVVLAV